MASQTELAEWYDIDRRTIYSWLSDWIRMNRARKPLL
jgi:hypothetical protein